MKKTLLLFLILLLTAPFAFSRQFNSGAIIKGLRKTISTPPPTASFEEQYRITTPLLAAPGWTITEEENVLNRLPEEMFVLYYSKYEGDTGLNMYPMIIRQTNRGTRLIADTINQFYGRMKYTGRVQAEKYEFYLEVTRDGRYMVPALVLSDSLRISHPQNELYIVFFEGPRNKREEKAIAPYISYKDKNIYVLTGEKRSEEVYQMLAQELGNTFYSRSRQFRMPLRTYEEIYTDYLKDVIRKREGDTQDW